jgi:hypothetical protein
MVFSPDALSDWKDDDDQLLLALAAPVARVLRNVIADSGIGHGESAAELQRQLVALRRERDRLGERLNVLGNQG